MAEIARSGPERISQRNLRHSSTSAWNIAPRVHFILEAAASPVSHGVKIARVDRAACVMDAVVVMIQHLDSKISRSRLSSILRESPKRFFNREGFRFHYTHDRTSGSP